MHNLLWQRLLELRLSTKSFALFSIVSVGAIPVGDFTATDTAADVFLEILLGVLATAVLGLYLWPLWTLMLKTMPAGSRRFIAILVAFAGGGVLRGLTIHYLGPAFNFDVDTVLLQRIGNSVATTVVWLTVFSLFTQATNDFSARYKTLMGGIIAARQRKLTPAELSGILGSLEAGLRGVILPAEKGNYTERQLTQLASALRLEILGKIRDHTRGLWVLEGVEVPRLRFFPLLKLALGRLEYSWVFFSLVFGIVGVANLATIIGFPEAAWRVAIAVGVIYGSDHVFRRVIRPFSQSRWDVHAGFLLAVGVLVMVPLGFFEFFLVGSGWSAIYLLVLAVPTALIPVMGSTLVLAQVARKELLSELETFNSSNIREGNGSRSGADLASFLHNSLQSEIHSIIFALEGAATDPTKVALGRSSLERLRLLANRSLDEQFDSFRAVPLEHLAQMVEGWRGILDVSVEWLPDSDVDDDPRVPTVVQIIQEVASNAVVHGGATALDVSVKVEGDDFVVSLVSNAPNSSRREAGQGDRWLESFAVASSKPSAPADHTSLEFRV